MVTPALQSWTDVAWNPVSGCAVAVSDRGAETDLRPYDPVRRPYVRRLRTRLPLPDVMAGEPLSTRTRLKSGWLRAPMGWREPLKICVCVHGDLFGAGAPDAKIDAVFAVTALAPQHTFQIATRRPDRLHQYLARQDRGGFLRPLRVEQAAWNINGHLPLGTFPYRLAWFPNVQFGFFAGPSDVPSSGLLEFLYDISAPAPFRLPASCEGEPVWMQPVQHGDQVDLAARPTRIPAYDDL